MLKWDLLSRWNLCLALRHLWSWFKKKKDGKAENILSKTFNISDDLECEWSLVYGKPVDNRSFWGKTRKEELYLEGSWVSLLGPDFTMHYFCNIGRDTKFLFI